MKATARYIQLLRTIIYIARFLASRKRYIRQFTNGFLEPFYKRYGKKLHPDTANRIFSNYIFATPLYIQAISQLQRGTDLTEAELQKSILVGILVPIYDDLLDLNQLPVKNQEAVFLHPESYQPVSMEDALVRAVMLAITNLGIVETGQYQTSKEHVFKSQVESAKQINSNASQETLREILNYKSEAALIFYYHMIDVPFDEGVEKSIRIFARLGQLTNDLFDVYKDHQEGIRTVANACEDFAALEKQFHEDISAFFAYTRSLGYAKKQTELYLSLLGLVLARALVLIRQFIKIQKRVGKGPLPFDQLPRKEFIGDMQTIPNILRVLRTAIGLSR